MESLEQSDLLYLNNANDGLAKAQAVVAFVTSVLATKYGLKEGDQVTPDGTIIRVGSYTGQADEEISGGTGEGEAEASKPS